MDNKCLSKETKDLLVGIAEELIVGSKISKNAFVAAAIEMGDAPAARIIINYIDKLGDKYIPDELDPKINEACTLAIAGNYVLAAQKVGEILDSVIDLKKVEDNIEKIVFVDGLTFCARMILLFIEKRKQEDLEQL